MWLVTFMLCNNERQRFFYSLPRLGEFLRRFAKVPTFELRQVKQVML